MSTRTVTNQAELDTALADPDVNHVTIDSPAGVWLTIGHTGDTTVNVTGHSYIDHCSGSVGEVTGSGRVGRVTDSGRVEWVTDSGSVGEVTGSGRVGWVTGSGRVEWVTGSGRVGRVTGSGRVGRVTGSGSVGRVTGSGSVGRVTDSGSVGRVTDSGSVGRVTGSGRVGEVTGSGRVGWVTGSGRVEWVTDSGSVGEVTGSGRVGWVTGSGRVEWVTGSGRVGWVTGSGRVGWVTGSGSVGRVTDSGSVGWVTGSGRVEWVTGSGSVGEVTGSGRVESASGTAVVHLHDEATLVRASSHVAVFLHSAEATVSGGHVIDLTTLDLTDPATWCDHHGVTVTDGWTTLYKAVRGDLRSHHGFEYPIGETVTCDDWADNGQCGGGLHFSPSPAQARSYDSDATRFLECQVALADLRPLAGGTAKCKAPSARVVCEVDEWCRPVQTKTEAAW